jgi:DNA helicase-2/ATP-dependent DNA helicase PcrA
MEFHLSQKEAIGHRLGPMLVLAGPGSGKTLVLTYRIKYLIEVCGVSPGKILVVTFTKAAAEEMKVRFQKIMGYQSFPVSFGTFHSLFFQILRNSYHLSKNSVATDNLKLEWLREIIYDRDLNLDEDTEYLNDMIEDIGKIKNKGISFEEFIKRKADGRTEGLGGLSKNFSVFFKYYEEKLRENEKIDFEDMALLCFELFCQREDILKLWQARFEYVLVDEFQDINPMQYEIVKMLAAPRNNLFIVGDDDQSIYGFRGANPGIMKQFTKDYENSDVITLKMNYRSTDDIVRQSLRLIQHNKNRFIKQIASSKGEGKKVVFRTFRNIEEETGDIIERLLEQRNDSFLETGILFRTSLSQRYMMDRLMEYHIPFTVKDRVPNMFEHWIGKDLIAYLKIAGGKGKRKDFLRVINRPNRYLKRSFFSEENICLENIAIYCEEGERTVRRLLKLKEELEIIGEMVPYASMQYIRKVIGYDRFLLEYAADHRIREEELLEFAETVMQSGRSFHTREEWFEYIERYEGELERCLSNKSGQANGVFLSTIHSAKGLEYKTVYVMDVNEGNLPHNKAVSDEEIEEERRLLYVALTRAREELYVYSVKERFQRPAAPSRFLEELKEENQIFFTGEEVAHKSFGRGRIVRKERGKLHIMFYEMDRKIVLDENYCVRHNILHRSEE